MTDITKTPYAPCLIDRNKIPFKELWQEARCFADDIVCAVGTDFTQKIAEAEHRFICDLLNRLQQMEVVDAAPVVRCRDCAVPHNKFTGCPKLNGLVTPPDFHCPFGERKDGVWKGVSEE